jgi:exodeoxyribonuclease III
MKLATWNVNSLNVRLPHVLDWLIRHQPDVLCLQETKVEDAKFPLEPLRAAGYEVLYSGQRTYNGVAILSRSPGSDVVTAIPGFECEQKRVLAATIAGVRVICVYVPNGQTVTSPKYEYKLSWLSALNRWLTSELQTHRQVAVAGDFNIAPEDRDVHDPKAWAGQVLFSAPERDALTALTALGLKDGFRLFEQPDASYTWWDYRMNAFRRKMGLRIDHVLLSGDLAQRCSGCAIDVEPRRLERPSDHAPISVELQL